MAHRIRFGWDHSTYGQILETSFQTTCFVVWLSYYSYAYDVVCHHPSSFTRYAILINFSERRAKEFSRSAIARDSDFSTNSRERGIFSMPSTSSSSKDIVPNPFISSRSSSFDNEDDSSEESRETLAINEIIRNRQRRIKGTLIVQFAANDAVQLADAAELVKPWVDGIDLNCGWSVSIPYSSPLVRSRDAHYDLFRLLARRDTVHKNGLTTKESDAHSSENRNWCETW